MTLTEFLSTANADDSLALTEARAIRTGRLISPDMMLAFITQFGYVDVLISNPVTNEAKAVQAAFQFGSEFNLINGHPASITPILDLLIVAGIVSETFKATLVYYANDQSDKAFPDVTLHDVKVARGSVVLKPITQSGGYAVISTNAVCELHSPRLLAEVSNPRTGETKIQRINNFYGVAAAKTYDAKVPQEYLAASLFVDDAYNVVV